MMRFAIIIAFLTGCAAKPSAPTAKPQPRLGDEIVINGHLVHTGTRVVLWADPGGFNGYAAGNFNARTAPIDQFVYHYDAVGNSRRCFDVLNERKLSVHFMCDTDGTIYQTLDVKERAWHATFSNSRSIGIEIANIGAFPPSQAQLLRGQRLIGEVQYERLVMVDFTPRQYDALIKLTAALCRSIPAIRCDYPRDASGRLITHVLPPAQLESYRGLIGHYHIQANKQDPGPAFQWDRVTYGARQLLR